MTESSLLRWGATVGFAACFAGALYTLGATVAPWVALGFGTLVFGIIMARLWVKHLEESEAARSRAEGQGARRFRAVEDTNRPALPIARRGVRRGSSPAASYYDDDEDGD